MEEPYPALVAARRRGDVRQLCAIVEEVGEPVWQSSVVRMTWHLHIALFYEVLDHDHDHDHDDDMFLDSALRALAVGAFVFVTILHPAGILVSAGRMCGSQSVTASTPTCTSLQKCG